MRLRHLLLIAFASFQLAACGDVRTISYDDPPRAGESATTLIRYRSVRTQPTAEEREPLMPFSLTVNIMLAGRKVGEGSYYPPNVDSATGVIAWSGHQFLAADSPLTVGVQYPNNIGTLARVTTKLPGYGRGVVLNTGEVLLVPDAPFNPAPNPAPLPRISSQNITLGVSY